MKNVNKQWSDIWIEEDGIHMLKMAYDRVFKIESPDYIGDDYVIKFDNVKKLKKLDYKRRRVMLVKLNNSNVDFEVPVNSFEEYMILKKNVLFKTVGTKRKSFALVVAAVILCMISTLNYSEIFSNLSKSMESIDLQRANIKYSVKR